MPAYHGPMVHVRWLVFAAVLAVPTLALLAVAADSWIPAVTGPSGPKSPASPRASSRPSAAAAGTPTPTRRPSLPPTRATGHPALAYAEFLQRLNGDRSTVDGLNSALATAAEAQDREAARTAAVRILDFVDTERDWLAGHPPAECYAPAHTAAGAMLDAYGSAADAFVTWSAAGGGLDGLAALARAADAAQTAKDSLTTFGSVLQGTTCPV